MALDQQCGATLPGVSALSQTLSLEELGSKPGDIIDILVRALFG